MGSPPRVRGKPERGRSVHRGRGITPARAGKTPFRQRCADGHEDHPRACGENTVGSILTGWNDGSPPRVRGKRVRERDLSRDERITPARAGKTMTVSATTLAAGDHPRACGENSRIGSRPTFHPGSPPRVRGKRIPWNAIHWRLGITPARAGKTARRFARFTAMPDHPRACGENLSDTVRGSSAAGSPPRVRGKHAAWYAALTADGITPARAGKTFSQTWSGLQNRDHPRACGENRGTSRHFNGDWGSPPRVRGKPCRTGL